MAPEPFAFSSFLPAEFREDLESVMFFNPQQPRVLSGILQAVERFGTPEVDVDGEQLRIKVGELKDVQSLFALAESDEAAELAGVILYLRTDLENILILHIGVAERFSSAGANAGSLLVLRLLQAVRDAVRRLKGVRTMTIVYPAGRRLMMPVPSSQPRIASATSLRPPSQRGILLGACQGAAVSAERTEST